MELFTHCSVKVFLLPCRQHIYMYIKLCEDTSWRRPSEGRHTSNRWCVCESAAGVSGCGWKSDTPSLCVCVSVCTQVHVWLWDSSFVISLWIHSQQEWTLIFLITAWSEHWPGQTQLQPYNKQPQFVAVFWFFSHRGPASLFSLQLVVKVFFSNLFLLSFVWSRLFSQDKL